MTINHYDETSAPKVDQYYSGTWGFSYNQNGMRRGAYINGRFLNQLRCADGMIILIAQIAERTREHDKGLRWEGLKDRTGDETGQNKFTRSYSSSWNNLFGKNNLFGINDKYEKDDKTEISWASQKIKIMFHVFQHRRGGWLGIFPSPKAHIGGEFRIFPSPRDYMKAVLIIFLSPKTHIDMGVPNPIYWHISSYSFTFWHLHIASYFFRIPSYFPHIPS